MTGKDEALEHLGETRKKVAALTDVLAAAIQELAEWVVVARTAQPPATWEEIAERLGRTRPNTYRDFNQYVKEAMARTQPKEHPRED